MGRLGMGFWFLSVWRFVERCFWWRFYTGVSYGLHVLHIHVALSRLDPFFIIRVSLIVMDFAMSGTRRAMG